MGTYSPTNTNMTTSAGLHNGNLSEGMQIFYNRTLLQTFEPNLVHLQFGDEYRLPPNSGTSMSMRKFIPIEATTEELEEGNPGDGVLISEVEVLVPIKQFGQYGAYSDKLDMTHIDVRVERETVRFGDAGSRSIDAVVRDALAESTNVIYAGGKTSRGALGPADKLTSSELRKAVRLLKKNHAQTFGGYYIAIVGPDTTYDLQEDEMFLAVSKYQDKENIYKGEIGRLFGCRIVETTEAKIFEKEGAGTPKADVASTIVLGKYAYGYTTLKSAKPRVIVKGLGSSGIADPLEQMSTIGWKMDGFGVKMLQPEYAVRIEHGFSA